MSAIDWLLESQEPGVVSQAKRDLLGEQDPPEAARVLDGPWVRALLAGQQADGGFGVNVYGKWGGAHWRLVSLVELGVPAGEERCVAAAETVLAWLTGKSHRAGVKSINGLVLRNEPLSRGRGKAHMIELAYRRGGRVVWANRRHPSGISDARYRRLTEKERQNGSWTQFVADPELFAKGAIRHPDHATIVLSGWHRVVMNTEQGARAMRHVVFLD